MTERGARKIDMTGMNWDKAKRRDDVRRAGPAPRQIRQAAPFKVKYGGTCDVCHKDIDVGDYAAFIKSVSGERRMGHVTCLSPR